MIRGYLKEIHRMCGDDLRSRLVVEVFRGDEVKIDDLRFGDYLDVCRPGEEGEPVNRIDAFQECCERAKEGDTNALGALPYLAERLISQAR